MSAETLRRAASLMRERAGAVSYRSPWYPTRSGFVGADLGPESSIIDSVAEVFPRGGSTQQQANAAHIASWHPVVALAVADWLEKTANQHEALTVAMGATSTNLSPMAIANSTSMREALAVAHLFLGES